MKKVIFTTTLLLISSYINAMPRVMLSCNHIEAFSRNQYTNPNDIICSQCNTKTGFKKYIISADEIRKEETEACTCPEISVNSENSNNSINNNKIILLNKTNENKPQGQKYNNSTNYISLLKITAGLGFLGVLAKVLINKFKKPNIETKAKNPKEDLTETKRLARKLFKDVVKKYQAL